MVVFLLGTHVDVLAGAPDALYLAEAASPFLEKAFWDYRLPGNIDVVFKKMRFSSSWFTGLVDFGYTEVEVFLDVKADFYVASFSENLSVKKRFWRNFSSRGDFFVSNSFNEFMNSVVEEIVHLLDEVWKRYLQKHGENVLVERVSRDGEGVILVEMRSFEPRVSKGRFYFFYSLGESLRDWRALGVYVREVEGNDILCELSEQSDLEAVSSLLGVRGYLIAGGV